jgi:prophage regulatory protein
MGLPEMESVPIMAAPKRGQGRPTALLTRGAETSASAARSEAIIREPECRRITGLSRSTRWRLERAGNFPRRRKISPGATGWLASEIAAWVAERAAA